MEHVGTEVHVVLESQDNRRQEDALKAKIVVLAILSLLLIAIIVNLWVYRCDVCDERDSPFFLPFFYSTD